MAVFAWEGQTRAGEVRKGEFEAPNEAAVVAQLRRQQLRPVSVKEKGKGLGFDIKLSFLQPKVKEKDLVVFTRQFATMISAGLPLVQCLDILAEQQPNVTFKKVLADVKATVEGGATFADSLKRHPTVFDDLYVNLVAAGEVGGILDTILNRLAGYIEKAMKLKGKVKGAMIYPIAILAVAIGVVTLLLWKVIPVFAKMFTDFGAALPGPTQFVINMSNWLGRNILFLVIVIAGVVVAIRQFNKTEKGKLIIDGFLLKLPVFGDLILKNAVAKFTRTLGTMISSGVPILDALDICSKTAGNKIIEIAIQDARTSISQGKTLAEPLGKNKVFPPMVTQMIGVGEQTGAMDSMLSKIADFYDDEVDTAVSALMSLLEPMIIVFLGVVIGGIVISMYLPIFQIAGAIK